MKRVTFTLSAKTGSLARARAAVRAQATRAGFDENQAYHLELATGEALTNVIRHAYKVNLAKNNKIVLNITLYRNKIKVSIRDFGLPVTVKKIRGRSLGRVRPGGLGVHLIHHCMDKVEYQPLKVGTRLILEKRLNKTT